MSEHSTGAQCVAMRCACSHWVQYYVWKEHQREGHLWQTHTVRTQHERHIVRRMFEVRE